VAESLRPFTIVEDRGFKSLMKTGRPEYYLPSKSTVSRDVRLVFVNVRKRMAKMMQVSRYYTQNLGATILNILPQEYEGNLNFATDAWTSPNHKSFVAVSVHFEHKGKPMCMILDVVEVAKVTYLLIVLKIILTIKLSRTQDIILRLRLRRFWMSSVYQRR
jgi:hypothetical protein